MSPNCLGQSEFIHFASAKNEQETSLLSTQKVAARITCLMILAALLFASGCAAMKPMHGIPARYMPDEFKPASRSGKKTINLSLLRQTPPPQYLLDAGDVLAIYVEGVLGDRKQVPPVHFPQNRDTPPSFGFPIPVRDDGTISLPMTRPINVRGMTISQVEDEIRKRLTLEKEVLIRGQERILVSLQRPRSYQILVIRQEAAGLTDISQGGQGTVNPGVLKRGTGRTVSLPAYQNDVLHALAQTGGLPGLDAENTIYIIRKNKNNGVNHQQMSPCGNGCFPQSRYDQQQRNQRIQQVSSVTVSQYQPPQVSLNSQFGGHSDIPVSNGLPFRQPTPVSMYPNSGHSTSQENSTNRSNWASTISSNPTVDSSNVIRIPIRLTSGDYPQFSEQDIILEDGDIVFIETRETEIFYTGGLLGGGQYTIPRDYDLDILGAISIAESSQAGGGSSGGGRQTGGVSALNQDITIGASNVIILRRLPNGKQVPIKIDLYKAIRNPEERIMIQPGDYVMLQYTRWEAGWAFAERHLLEGALFGLATSQLITNGNN